LAALLAASLGSNAWALALGRISVQSKLGEPLQAEIDLPAVTDAEASTLALSIAPPERFRAANLEFNVLLQDISLTLERRENGRAVVVVRSTRPVSEPFLDLVVQARWAGGELLRGYTLLIDPPNLRPPLAVEPSVAPNVSAKDRPAPAPALAPAPAPSTPVAGERPVVSAAPATRPREANTVTVRRGDTAARIAQAHKPAGVTLEQMLVALLRQNPQAFIRGNVNLVKAGAVLTLPDEGQLADVDAAQARRLVAAQTRDFNEYRRRLAAAAPAQTEAPAARTASGSVQAAVADQAAPAEAQDKLTLSKPGAAAAQEARIASERQQADTAQRVAELNRNLQELEQLRQQVGSTASAPAPAAPTAPAEPAAAASTAPAAEGDNKPGEAKAEDAAATAQAPAAAAVQPPAPPAPAPAPAPAAPEPASPGIVRTLIDHPLTVPAASGLAVVLLGAAWWLMRARRAVTHAEREEPDANAEPENAPPMPPVSDTDDTAVAHVNADEAIDPVAEADLYLSVGREQQAETVLLDALDKDPNHLAARMKLLELYAQRPDSARFEAAARALLATTGGEGPEWQRACELGLAIDPDNPLYRPQTGLAAPTSPDAQGDEQAFAAAETPPATADPAPADAATEALPDLEFDWKPAPAASSEPAPAPDAAGDAQAPATTLPPELAELSLELPADEPEPPVSREESPAPEATVATATDDGLGFETDEPADSEDPLETKLSLAREFEAIGDIEGARTLAEEVVAEAQGDLKERAQAFLAKLSA
jgi:pilus assembly protein FimV